VVDAHALATAAPLRSRRQHSAALGTALPPLDSLLALRRSLCKPSAAARELALRQP